MEYCVTLAVKEHMKSEAPCKVIFINSTEERYAKTLCGNSILHNIKLPEVKFTMIEVCLNLLHQWCM